MFSPSCFNPHARVGRDLWPQLPRQDKGTVSIHTPVWGVTFSFSRWCSRSFVSIHTPVWGVTLLPLFNRVFCRVSIHTPVWGVTAGAAACMCGLEVSIHTPVWGVTFFCMFLDCKYLCFNPHARVGRDRLCFYDMCFSALIGVKCESLGLHLQKYSFFIEFASNILIIKWCERIGISALLMVLVYIIRSALKLKELSIPMCSTFPSQ